MYKQITSNKRRSAALMFGFVLLYGLIGFVLSLWLGQIAFYLVLGVAFVMLIFNLYLGDDLVMLVSGARKIEAKEHAPELWRMVENLSITAGIPMPRLYISPDQSPNAFAAGRKPEQAIVCCTVGLLQLLDEEELEGVLAHEISHIRNFDVRLMTYAAVLAGSIALVANMIMHMMFFNSRDSNNNNPVALIAVLLTAILAPLAATLIQLSISRKREYVADASAVELTRYPQGLASALAQISGANIPSERLSNTAISHLMIAAPLKGKGRASKLFSTHPPAEERIALLTEMAGGATHQHEQETQGRALPR